jgi:hypothetical protein
MSKLMDLMDAWIESKDSNYCIPAAPSNLLDFEFEIVKVPLVKEIKDDYFLKALQEKKIKEAEEALFRELHPIEKIDWDRVQKNKKFQYEESPL